MQAELETELRDESGMVHFLFLDLVVVNLLIEFELGAQSLCLRWTPAFGHICHIKGKDLKITRDGRMANATSVSSSKSTHSFHLPVCLHLY